MAKRSEESLEHDEGEERYSSFAVSRVELAAECESDTERGADECYGRYTLIYNMEMEPPAGCCETPGNAWHDYAAGKHEHDCQYTTYDMRNKHKCRTTVLLHRLGMIGDTVPIPLEHAATVVRRVHVQPHDPHPGMLCEDGVWVWSAWVFARERPDDHGHVLRVRGDRVREGGRSVVRVAVVDVECSHACGIGNHCRQ